MSITTLENKTFDPNAKHLLTYEQAIAHREHIMANIRKKMVYDAFSRYTGNYRLDATKGQKAVRQYMKEGMTQEMREAGIDEYMVFGSFSFSASSFSSEMAYDQWKERAFTFFGEKTVARIYIDGFLIELRKHYPDPDGLISSFNKNLQVELGFMMQAWLAYMVSGLDAERHVLKSLQESEKLKSAGWTFKRAPDYLEYDDVDLIGTLDEREYYFSVKLAIGAFQETSIEEYRNGHGKTKPDFYINENLEYKHISDLTAVQQFPV